MKPVPKENENLIRLYKAYRKEWKRTVVLRLSLVYLNCCRASQVSPGIISVLNQNFGMSDSDLFLNEVFIFVLYKFREGWKNFNQ